MVTTGGLDSQPTHVGRPVPPTTVLFRGGGSRVSSKVPFHRFRRRRLVLVTAAALMLGALVLAGSGAAASSSSQLSGPPIKVMTISPVQYNGPSFKNILEAARVYGSWINAHGGING